MSSQNNNNDSQDITNTNYNSLKPVHIRCIELRYLGHTYKEISSILLEQGFGVTDGVLRQWFKRDGQLYEPYLKYSKEQNEGLFRVAQEEIKKLTQKIPARIEQLLDRKDSSGQPDVVVLMTIKMLAEMFGLAINADLQKTDKLKEYFDRLEKMSLPEKKETPQEETKKEVLMLPAPK